MFGLLFCQHFKELCGKVNDGVHRGQDQKVMFLFGRLGGMEENKKSGGGDVRAEALSWDGEWNKA